LHKSGNEKRQKRKYRNEKTKTRRTTKMTKLEIEQIAAVRKDWYALQYIENQSEAVRAAQDRRVIRLIRNPSEKVQLAAVEQNGDALRFIKNPSEAVKLAAAHI